jgi:hypothetical protein
MKKIKHNKELNNFLLCDKNYESDQIKNDETGSLEMRNICHNLVGKPEGERPFGRPSHTWDDNIKMNLKLGVRM